MKSSFLVTIESEHEITPLSIERVLYRGFPTSVEEVSVEAAQPSVRRTARKRRAKGDKFDPRDVTILGGDPSL